MTTKRACPNCELRFDDEPEQGISCPRCGHDTVLESQASQGITTATIIKTIVAAAVGMAPGAIFLYFGHPLGYSLFVMALGAFIGSAFVLAKLSVANVAGLTAAVVIARNAPPSMRNTIFDALTDSGDDKNKDSSTEPHK